MLKLFSKPTIQSPSTCSCFTHSLQCWMQCPRLEIFFWNTFTNDINLLGVVSMQEVPVCALLCPGLRWLLVHRQAKTELIISSQDCCSLNDDTLDFFIHYISWELADVITECPHWFWNCNWNLGHRCLYNVLPEILVGALYNYLHPLCGKLIKRVGSYGSHCYYSWWSGWSGTLCVALIRLWPH